jgi:hypothetical protein
MQIPPDAQAAVPPMDLAAATMPADAPRSPAARRRHVTFRCPVVIAPPECRRRRLFCILPDSPPDVLALRRGFFQYFD